MNHLHPEKLHDSFQIENKINYVTCQICHEIIIVELQFELIIIT